MCQPRFAIRFTALDFFARQLTIGNRVIAEDALRNLSIRDGLDFERVHADEAQADGTDATQLRRGMGVGLAVCKAIAKVHNAKLWIEDRLPQGAVMCFQLPVLPQPNVVTEA